MTEWGGTPDKPRSRDNYWYRTFLDETPTNEGMIIRVSKRPRTKRGQMPFPTFRAVQRNPAGILWTKVKQGEFVVLSENEFQERWSKIQEAIREKDKNKESKLK